MQNTEFETVWSGNTWRTYPRPELGTTAMVRTDPRQKETTVNGRKLVAAVNRQVVRAAFTSEWRSANQLARFAGMTVQGVRRHLRDALNDGVCECRVVPAVRSWGRSERQYRVPQVEA
ncbi:hypothetical protein UFOVP1236_16 [uncultured Caudovirales phage]|uniref:Uncharacterized protein n=1 Tax=uncultured Caudovirales phage TaxID=2100421 RepID=A0A6J5R4F7_9CAUD|nr:hypothetical protein UFOVP1236_16 [uncultured Caudovirales phage]